MATDIQVAIRKAHASNVFASSADWWRFREAVEIVRNGRHDQRIIDDHAREVGGYSREAAHEWLSLEYDIRLAEYTINHAVFA